MIASIRFAFAAKIKPEVLATAVCAGALAVFEAGPVAFNGFVFVPSAFVPSESSTANGLLSAGALPFIPVMLTFDPPPPELVTSSAPVVSSNVNLDGPGLVVTFYPHIIFAITVGVEPPLEPVSL